MRLQEYIFEKVDLDKSKTQIKKERKATKTTLKRGLRKLDNHVDEFIDQIEKEIDKIEENPTFQYKTSQMLTNLEKETGEFLIALRQMVHTLGSTSQVVPQTRGHAKGAVPDAKPAEAGGDAVPGEEVQPGVEDE